MFFRRVWRISACWKRGLAVAAERLLCGIEEEGQPISSINRAILVQNQRSRETGQEQRIPICARLAAVLKSIKVGRLDGRLFGGITSAQVSTALRRAFATVGLAEFSAKSLRHFTASMLADAGLSRMRIASVLGHGAGSRCTEVYVHAFDSSVRAAFSAFDRENDFENAEARR